MLENGFQRVSLVKQLTFYDDVNKMVELILLVFHEGICTKKYLNFSVL